MEDKDKGHWLTPQMASVIGVVFTLSVTGLVGLTYTPMRSDIEGLRRDIEDIKTDPGPKPETKVRIEAISERINDISRRLDRVEERINSLHVYIMQALPIPPTRPAAPGSPFQRRGDLEVVR